MPKPHRRGHPRTGHAGRGYGRPAPRPRGISSARAGNDADAGTRRTFVPAAEATRAPRRLHVTDMGR
jgi:hypothetical protein